MGRCLRDSAWRQIKSKQRQNLRNQIHNMVAIESIVILASAPEVCEITRSLRNLVTLKIVKLIFKDSGGDYLNHVSLHL